MLPLRRYHESAKTYRTNVLPLNDWYSTGRRVLRILFVLVPSTTGKYPGENGLPVTDGIRYPRGIIERKKERKRSKLKLLSRSSSASVLASSFLTYSPPFLELRILIENSSARGGPHEYQPVPPLPWSESKRDRITVQLFSIFRKHLGTTSSSPLLRGFD